MKKRVNVKAYFAVLLAALYILAPVSASASAMNTPATAQEITLNSPKNVMFSYGYPDGEHSSFSSSDLIYLKFTAPESVYYEFTVTGYESTEYTQGNTPDISVNVIDSYGSNIGGASYNQYTGLTQYAFKLNAGESYFIQFSDDLYNTKAYKTRTYGYIEQILTLTVTNHTHTMRQSTYYGSDYYQCAFCDYNYYQDDHTHIEGTQYKANVEKATPASYGTYDLVTPCSICGTVMESKQVVVPQAKVKLKQTKYNYTGKNIFPKVTTGGAKYSASYPKTAKSVGRYSVVIKLKGELYEGTVTKTYDILPLSGKIKSAKKSSSGKATIKWKKVKGVSGYEVQISKSSDFSRSTKRYNASKKTTSASLTLSKNSYYFVRVRTYKLVDYNGKRIKLYSAWSSSKQI